MSRTEKSTGLVTELICKVDYVQKEENGEPQCSLLKLGKLHSDEIILMIYTCI